MDEDYITDYTGLCGNCHSYIGNDNYCCICGTKAGEGKFLPFYGQCLYGPPPVRQDYECTACGHKWNRIVYIYKHYEYCPKCGQKTAKSISEPKKIF